MKIATRKTDNLILEWIRLRQAGKSTRAIALMFNVHGGYVRAATNKVRAADIAASGQVCQGDYWS